MGLPQSAAISTPHADAGVLLGLGVPDRGLYGGAGVDWSSLVNTADAGLSHVAFAHAAFLLDSPYLQ